MRVAIATDNGMISLHFGRCREYTVFDIKEGKIAARTTIPNPGHAPGLIPQLLAQNNVDVIISGGMGSRAQGFFQQFNIEAISGAQGDVDSVIQTFIEGQLSAGENTCDHDSPDHQSCKE